MTASGRLGPAPRGASRPSQNQACIVGEGAAGGPLLIRGPFCSVSHLQVGAHAAKGPAHNRLPPFAPSSLLVLIPHPAPPSLSLCLSPHRCFPPFPPPLHTISSFHFWGKFCSVVLFGESLSCLLFCPLWVLPPPPFYLVFFSPSPSLALLSFALLLLYLSIYSPADAVPFVLSPMTFLRGIA